MSIAFKEWALVCEALGTGAQSIILRKGGIAEGREGFRFKHADFFLFPTLFHEQLERTTLAAGTPLPQGEAGWITIRYWAQVEWTARIEDLEVARALQPFHIWRDEVVAERFGYGDERGLHLAMLRVYRLARPWTFADAPAYGGCRSWVTIPETDPELMIEPVLPQEEHWAAVEKVRLASAGGSGAPLKA